MLLSDNNPHIGYNELILEPDIISEYESFILTAYQLTFSLNLTLNSLDSSDVTIFKRSTKLIFAFYPNAISIAVENIRGQLNGNIPPINKDDPVMERANKLVATNILNVILNLYERFTSKIKKKISDEYPYIFDLLKEKNNKGNWYINHKKLLDYFSEKVGLPEVYKPFLYSLIPLRQSLTHLGPLKEDVFLYEIKSLKFQNDNLEFELSVPRVYKKGGMGLMDPIIVANTVLLMVILLSHFMGKDLHQLVEKYDFI